MWLKDSFIELKGRERAKTIFDTGTFKEILGPYDYAESPHLEIQGVVPESDDGVIIARGKINSQYALVISIEGIFLNGGIGEVSGAKFSGALNLALEENKKGNRIIPIIMFDSGEVRLQEANYGLMAVSEIQSSIIKLRKYVPVIGIIAGNRGNCGSLAVTAALCSRLIMTRHGKYFMNEPSDTEEKVGKKEFNFKDKRFIWSVGGGNERYVQGFCDYLVEDDIDRIKSTVLEAMSCDGEENLRSRNQAYYLSKIWEKYCENGKVNGEKLKNPSARGRIWFEKLAGRIGTDAVNDSVLSNKVVLGGIEMYILSVVPNLKNVFKNARNGEFGLYEGLTIAERLNDLMKKDEGKSRNEKTPILAVVDITGQAYGYEEEIMGEFQSCACAVDAYATAREKGHPVIALIVGKAVSSGFLSHGCQANRILAFDDPEVFIHLMNKECFSKALKKGVEYVDKIAERVPGISYDIKSCEKIGLVSTVIRGVNADEPSDEDMKKVEGIIVENVKDIRESSSTDLCAGIKNEKIKGKRGNSLEIIEKLEKEWKSNQQ